MSVEADVVRYERRGPVAVVTMNRPDYRNAQNSAMTYALDDAFARAVNDAEVKVIVLAGEGKHFSAGHDIGTPGRDVDVSFDRRAVMWWDHTDRAGGDQRFARESEVYLGMCRRWREIPKPMIAMVQGACIAGGLMLAWVCDLIVASDDAFFADPGGAHGDSGRRVLRAPVGARAARREGGAVHRRAVHRPAGQGMGHGQPDRAARRARTAHAGAGGEDRRRCRSSASRWRRRPSTSPKT